MSLRLLDTGTARDISGVLRITVGANIERTFQDIRKRVEEKEVLYFVGGDGGVKVFERGQWVAYTFPLDTSKFETPFQSQVECTKTSRNLMLAILCSNLYMGDDAALQEADPRKAAELVLERRLWCKLMAFASVTQPSWHLISNQSAIPNELRRCIPYSALVDGPLASLGAPVWKPFLNFLGTPFMCLIRPVPVVFLRLAFSPQLSAILR